MNWGDVPAWAAFVLSGAAVWISIKARGDGQRSADASVTAAQASVRSAIAAEESLAAQLRAEQEARDAAAEAARPRVEWDLERTSLTVFHLRNVGTAVAQGVTIPSAGQPGQGRHLPDGETLGPNEASRFEIMTSLGASTPSVIYVKWDEQPDPVAVRVPTW
jgi:hypothetical protein